MIVKQINHEDTKAPSKTRYLSSSLSALVAIR